MNDTKRAQQLHGLSRRVSPRPTLIARRSQPRLRRRQSSVARSYRLPPLLASGAFAPVRQHSIAAVLMLLRRGRTLANNVVVGVSSGFEKKLTLQGVGYKAAVEGTKQLNLALGYSHPVEMPIPAGLSVKARRRRRACRSLGRG